MIVGYQPPAPEWAVYALRLKGESEVRYVGMTSGKPAARLERHLFEARRGWATHKDLGATLLAGEAEMVVLSIHDNGAAARAAERDAIRLLATLGHRLCNTHHNHAAKRQRTSPAKVAA